jgi:putative two-component system response regulator
LAKARIVAVAEERTGAAAMMDAAIRTAGGERLMESVKILAVDDVQMNLEMLEVMLSNLDATVLKASHGKEALQILGDNTDTDTILLDLEMPVMNGFDLLTVLKSDDRYRDIPVIVVTADRNEVLRSLSLGANDFLTKPYNPEELRLRVRNHLRTKKLLDISNDMSLALEREVIRKTGDLRRALEFSRKTELEISLRLGKAAEFRDTETGLHTKRISEFSNLLGKLSGLSRKGCEVLRYSSPLHDVGKIGIPDRILLKPGKLDHEEYMMMQQHTVIGGKILSGGHRHPVIAAGQIIAMQHHEKWDGSGYPRGLAGKNIHIFGRIVMVVDVFDALMSDRPYKKALSLEETLHIMSDGRGAFFDPELLDIFLENIEQFTELRAQLHDQEADGEPLSLDSALNW